VIAFSINLSAEAITALEYGFLGLNEKIKKNFHKDCIIRSVRKAEKEGVSVEECLSEGSLKEFYRVQALTRKRLGFPIQPYIFFKNMWEIKIEMCIEHS
jgi:lipid II:glycine glycyltransferase (peptidoglycan interpeptide bridge formation enzyme)